MRFISIPILIFPILIGWLACLSTSPKEGSSLKSTLLVSLSSPSWEAWSGDSGKTWANRGQYFHVNTGKANESMKINLYFSTIQPLDKGHWIELAAVSGREVPEFNSEHGSNDFERFNGNGFHKVENLTVLENLSVTTDSNGYFTVITKRGIGDRNNVTSDPTDFDTMFDQVLAFTRLDVYIASGNSGGNNGGNNGGNTGGTGDLPSCSDIEISHNYPTRELNNPELDQGGYADRIKLTSFRHKQSNLKLTFISGDGNQAPYGGRLYSVRMNDKEILYQNKKPEGYFAKISGWGRPNEGAPFISLGGVEYAYPNNEHGLYANRNWTYEIISCDSHLNTPVFRVTGPNDAGPIPVINTYISGNNKWIQELTSQTSLTYMYYFNVMIPAGYFTKRKENNLDSFRFERDEIEVLADITNVVIHSSDGEPWGVVQGGSYDSNKNLSFDYAKYPNTYGLPNLRDGKDKYPEHMHTWFDKVEYQAKNKWDPKEWIGWFNASTAHISDYGIKNSTKGYELKISAIGSSKIYPKFFCGRATKDMADMTHPQNPLPANVESDFIPRHLRDSGVIDSQELYCEMWFSPNAISFWHESGLLDARSSFEFSVDTF